MLYELSIGKSSLTALWIKSVRKTCAQKIFFKLIFETWTIGQNGEKGWRGITLQPFIPTIQQHSTAIDTNSELLPLRINNSRSTLDIRAGNIVTALRCQYTITAQALQWSYHGWKFMKFPWTDIKVLQK